MSYSASERAFAIFLSNFPAFKKWVKRAYQWINWVIFRQSHSFISTCDLQLVVPSSENETYFGYYDESVENISGTHLLVHEYASNTKKRPIFGDKVTIHVVEKETNHVVFSASSRAFNFQQGAKVRWLDDSHFCFNDYCSLHDQYFARVFTVDGRELEPTEMPVYDAFGMDFFLSLRFERLSLLRPDYGYFAHQRTFDVNELEADGVWRCYFDGRSSELICSLERLASLSPRDSMLDAVHKVNHLSINPAGDRFIFLHRWKTPVGKRFDRLLVMDIDGSNLKILADDEMVSHCAWLNETDAVGYFRYGSHGDAHYLVSTVTGEISLLSTQLVGLGDGHQSIKNGKMIFDSYPNRARMKDLFIYHFATDKVEKIASFYESMAYDLETRCDLHPRWSTDGGAIYVDSVHSGKRQLWRLVL